MIAKYFTYQYLFGPAMPALQRSDKAILYFGAALAVLGLLIFLYAQTVKVSLKKGLALRWGNLFFWIGLLLAIWYAFRYELVMYLSVHAVAFGLVIAGIIWAFYIIKYQLTAYRRRTEEYRQQQMRSKYL